MVSCRYKVFLSFRGEDTRNIFVGHLYRALCNKGIHTFKDDPILKRGESIGPVILDAIQDSRSSLVVLSQDYASSTWCLSELVKILECRDKEDLKQIVVPIFYKVDPSDVSDHKGKFKEALDKHEANFTKEFCRNEEKYKEAMQKLKKWKEALTQVANLSGWDSQHFRDEATFVKQIVRDISDKLTCESSSDATELVGMCSHITEMDQLLQLEKRVVRMVGIWGIDGIGKTKIARVMYDKLFSQFDAGCFINNVADKFRKHGVSALKKELLSKTLLEKNLDLWPLDRDSNVIKEKLGRKKVLIVVDDVGSLEQLEVLVKPDWFGLGSRIIITTQDKQLLVAHEVKDIYKVPYLEHDQALQLFCRYAFKQNQPKKDYLELSNSFLSYINGHPLALKVLGSFLFKKSPKEWQSELEKLGTYSNKTIQELLEIVYSGLEDAEKRAFLDIACFFNGENENFVKSILDGCGFFADTTLRVLKDKAMITTSENKLFMHELLQEMGREMVRKESEEYGERSRLWNHEHIGFILTKPKETGKVEGIFLDTAEGGNVQIHPQAFAGLHKLRLLKFYNFRSLAQNCNVKLTHEGLSSLSEVLRFLHWPEYPLTSLPLKFCPRYLVELNLPYSSIQQLWLGKQPLVHLISVDLNHSDLEAIPDLSEAKKLQRLNLQGCSNLTEASSIEHLTGLQYLNCKDCEKLRNLPSMINLIFLRTLDLSNCLNLKKIIQLPANIKYLYLVRTAIQELPLPIGSCLRLITLDLRNCTRLENLPQEIFRLTSLKNLNIAGCPRLLRLLTGDEMEIPNEEAKEEKEEEFGKMESTELEMQESSGVFRGEDTDSKVDKSVDPIFEQSERIEINVSKFVSTEVSSTVDVPAPNDLPNLVPSSPTLDKRIHVSQADLSYVAVTENTNSKGDSQLYCADVVSLHSVPMRHFVYSSSSFSCEDRCVLEPVSKQKATNSARMVEKENSDVQVSSIEPPTTPVSGTQKDINFEPSMTEAGSITLTSTRLKTKRPSTKKVATSIKKRRFNDEKSKASKPSICSTRDTMVTCKRPCPVKIAASIKKKSKLVLSKKKEVVREIEGDISGKTKDKSEELNELHQIIESEEGMEKDGHGKPSYQESASANEPTQQTAVLAPRSSVSINSSCGPYGTPASLFANLADALVSHVDTSVTSSVEIGPAIRQLYSLLKMELQDLVCKNGLKESTKLINLLEKEKNCLSKEQRACLLHLKNLEQWGNSFRESKQQVAEATETLTQLEKIKEKLVKASDEYKQVSDESRRVSLENKETVNCLAQVQQQIEETNRKLRELQDDEKRLTEKVKLQQIELDNLSRKEVELSDATVPLCLEYDRQKEITIRDRLNDEEQNVAVIDEAYRRLQKSFSTFCQNEMSS